MYAVVRDNLYDQIDAPLSRHHDGREEHDLPRDRTLPSTVPEHLPLADQVFLQIVDRDGDVLSRYGDRRLPVTADVLAVARGERKETFFDAEVAGTSVRVYVTPAGQGTVLELGRSLAEVEQTLPWPPYAPTWSCSPAPTSWHPRTGRCSSATPSRRSAS